MASADFSLRVSTSPFQAQGEISPGKNALLRCTTAGFTPLRLDHESFAVAGPLALLSSALYPILVHRLAAYAPRFLPTIGHPLAVALRFVRGDQLTAGLTPAGVRPCWAHQQKSRPSRSAFLWVLGWRAEPPALAGSSCGCCLPALTRFTALQCGETRHGAEYSTVSGAVRRARGYPVRRPNRPARH